MKKITLLALLMICVFGFSQSKTTGDILLSAARNITANFTLNNTTSKVTLVFTGPTDRWFALGMGPTIVSGFSMSAGDVLVYSTSLTDRKFNGFGNPVVDTSQDWIVVSNLITGTKRTLTLERNLTNADTTGSDLQFPYSTTDLINVVCAFPNSATTVLGSGHGRAYATGVFSSLSIDDFSLNTTSIYPNPSNGSFNVLTKTSLDIINVYSQTGQFIKKIDVTDKSNKVDVNIKGLSTGIYLIELQNATEKSWKKVIIE